LIHNRHAEWRRKLKRRGIRPLTIIVTKDISGCERVTDELADFLVEWEKISSDRASEKVLPVTSASKHQANLARLKLVDTPQSKVEWIVSVSMLSEGWDVKNVFQIVPHEERAFNSKLLIAQVLGRGLRRPDGWQGEDPMVTVFNHDAWSGRIRHLVNEILEIERRLSSTVNGASPYNFELHNLDYNRVEDTSEYAKKGEYRFLERGYVDLPTQVEEEDVTIDFERAVSGERSAFRTQIRHKTWSVEEVADQMYNRLRSIDEESKDATDPEERTNYANRLPRSKCEAVIRESLKRAGIKDDRIIDENRQKFLQALGTLRRRAAKRVIYTLAPRALLTLNTRERQAESCSAADLRRGYKTVFYPPECEDTLIEEQREFFREIQDPDGDFHGQSPITNAADFKTPANLIITEAQPESKFVRLLCDRDNARAIDAWFKNAPVGFYSIEFAWKKGEHPKRSEFSPDFFIKQGDHVYAIEI
jgi:type III restriction enzyme